MSEPEKQTEADVPVDEATAASRVTGGVPNEDAPDQASTTGTTPDDEYVGRVAGDDAFSEETGAEVRSQH